MDPSNLLLLLVAYLCGSFPSAYLVTRLATGKDIRHLGDGNMGAKNTFHAVGWLAGALVGIMDVGKGAAVVGMAQFVSASADVVLPAGICVVLGHDFPISLG
jgi:acyl phosphate:glycerol-3-phosphate acyltransferase